VCSSRKNADMLSCRTNGQLEQLWLFLLAKMRS
jgi:hypothetical protein